MSEPEPPTPEATPTIRERIEAFRTSPRGERLAAGYDRVRPALLWAGLGLGALILVGLGIFALLWVTTDVDDVDALRESAVILDRSGAELAVLSQDGNRMSVDLADLPTHVPDALVAAEDRRFYEHAGVDVFGIGRALWNNLTEDGTQGGSTITQQLVKNRYLTSERTLTRKAREAVYAVKVERKLDKDEILEQYLNTVYFGRGAYGIEAAARAYFDAAATDLDPARAAMLVGILKAPESYDPLGDPDTVVRRRDQVLDAMVEMGTLDAADRDRAVAQKIKVTAAPPATILTEGIAPHFIELVRSRIIEDFGEEALYRDGLRITTTLDLADQKAAEAAVAAALDDPEDPQAAVVGVDRTGAVRAWVGGRDFETLQVDLVAGSGGSGRQPGSIFKPIVLAEAFNQGIGAGTPFAAPAEITLDAAGEPWTVSNAGGSGYGRLSLLDATVNSVNTVYAQAVLRVGPGRVADLAADLGVTAPLSAEASIALGTEEVTPLDMATVYSTLAREGRRVDPYFIEKIERGNGSTVFERDDDDGDEVLAPNVAATVSAVLSETPRRGTARRAALDRPMAAKTGTTQGNADAWLAGYTPEYTAIVWVGNADNNDPMGLVDGQRVFGGSIPAQIWHDFMVVALEDVEPTAFPEPDPELLGDNSPEVTLVADPAQADPGGLIQFRATGIEVCLAGWQVVVNGPVEPARTAPTPASDGLDGEDGDTGKGKKVDGADAVASPNPAEPGPVRVITIEGPIEAPAEGAGTTLIDVPSDASHGRYAAVLRCDVGSGGTEIAGTDVVVGSMGPDPSELTTTTTSSTTSTTPTTSSTTTSTTAPDSTTTTTAPEGGDPARSTSTTSSTTAPPAED